MWNIQISNLTVEFQNKHTLAPNCSFAWKAIGYTSYKSQNVLAEACSGYGINMKSIERH
jgi:hypothetical protein